jgi:TQXA domain-containing protein/LPXTG-motif cell wall-anchored protein
MFRLQRRWSARLSAALVATGLAAAGAIATAVPASADGQNSGGATAVLGNLTTSGPAVIHSAGKDENVSAGLFDLQVDGGGSLQTYCIDILHHTQPHAKYQETAWDQSTLSANKDAGRILWVLQNSYPQVSDLSKLASEIGSGSLTKEEAAAGTQVAIWRFSDHVDVDAKDGKANTLANWLTKNAQVLNEPKPSLSLTPAAVSGKSGGKIGPVKVQTSAASATVSLDPAFAAKGVKVVDANGKMVQTAANGSDLYFDVPKGLPDGGTSLSVKATTTLPVGRVFTGVGANQTSQTQILAGSSASTVEAAATATWAAPETKGPIPAITATSNCDKGGVDINVTNKGDEDFAFELEGKSYTIAAGKSQTILFPVGEDKAYEIKIAMPQGPDKVFSGILNCKTDTSGTTPSSQPTPASAGGSTGGGGNLAETGSSSATPIIAGVAAALVVVGGGTVFFLRKRKSAAGA